MKTHEIMVLVAQYGPDITLGELLKRVQGQKVHKCPKCNGTGEITEEYNGYPNGLPDSGSVYEAAYRTVTCDLCKGEGYTGKLMKPRMIQDGWEEEEAFDKKAELDPCEGKMCYKFDGPSCENCSELVRAYNMFYERCEFKCNKKGTTMTIPLRNVVGGMEIHPGSFNKEEEE